MREASTLPSVCTARAASAAVSPLLLPGAIALTSASPVKIAIRPVPM